MASANGQLASAGLVGALAAVVIDMTGWVVPDGNAKAAIAVFAGMLASLAAFEVMSWFVRLRLSRYRLAVNRLIPEIEALQMQVDGAVARQIKVMADNGATRQEIRQTERKLIDSATAIANALDEFKRKSLEITLELRR